MIRKLLLVGVALAWAGGAEAAIQPCPPGLLWNKFCYSATVEDQSLTGFIAEEQKKLFAGSGYEFISSSNGLSYLQVNPGGAVTFTPDIFYNIATYLTVYQIAADNSITIPTNPAGQQTLSGTDIFQDYAVLSGDDIRLQLVNGSQGAPTIALSTGSNPFIILRVSAVPEPITWLTMTAGFGLVGMSLRRRRQACMARK